jgi:pimeloyl-ACP methyl ester carboxylesterase
VTSTAGLRWRVDGAGRDLVLVHGWALAMDYWDALVPLLPQFRVLRFDRRGFGGSGGTPSLESDATDLFHLMDRAGMQQAAVLGMSQGARIAVAAALAHPARVSALVLDGPPLLGSVDAADATTGEQEVPLQKLLALWRSEGDVALRRAVAALPLMTLVNATQPASAALEHCIAAYRGADLLDALRPPRVQHLADLQLPVLVINGEQESAQRLQAGQRLALQIAGCRREVIPAAGHLAALDSPAGYAAVLSGFLAAAPRD